MRTKKENDEPDNHNCSKQGIFGKYTNYGYTSDRTTTDEISTNTNDTVDTNKETETNNSINNSTRDEPTTTNNATEVKLPNEIKALSRQKLTDNELKTYGDAMEEKEEGMMRV